MDCQSKAIDTPRHQEDEEFRDHLIGLLFQCEIFTRLSSQTLYENCRRVSKTWRGWVQSPIFIGSHLEKSIRNSLVNVVMFNSSNNCIQTRDCDTFNPVTETYRLTDFESHYSVMGSCNGLVCFGTSLTRNFISKHKFVIYNPATRAEKSFYVPPLRNDAVENPGLENNFGFGFGFGCSLERGTNIQDYRLVFIRGREIYVYDMKSLSLRMIEDYSPDKRLWTSSWSPEDGLSWLSKGVSTGNVVHWVLTSDVSNNDIKSIFSIDLSDGTQIETRLPNKHNLGKPWLVPLRKRLYIVSNCYGVVTHSKWVEVNVWVMKKYGSYHDSWDHLFNVKLYDIWFSAVPISLKEGGRKVLFQLWQHQYHLNKKNFVWYDLITTKRDDKGLYDVSSNLIAEPCFDGLVDSIVM